MIYIKYYILFVANYEVPTNTTSNNIYIELGTATSLNFTVLTLSMC